MGEFKTKDGKGSYHVNLNDTQWWGPSENPFGWGCCHCGSWHRVLYRESNGPLGFELYLTDDPEETKRLQEHILANPSEYPGNHLQTIADLRAELAEKERDINHLWQRDSVWRAKKEMLENDLAKAWERVERAERVLGIVGRMRERVLNRPPGVIIPMWVHDAIEEAEAVRGPEGEDERD